jgi:hypothetical protein
MGSKYSYTFCALDFFPTLRFQSDLVQEDGAVLGGGGHAFVVGEY